MSDDLQEVSDKLAQAIRRRHEAMKVSLASAIRQDQKRRVRRRKTIRTSAVSLGVVLALSGTALAAGDALGVIDLGGGVSAVEVSSIPVWNGTTGTFITGKSANGSYFYHLTGGKDLSIACGPTDPHPINNIYVISTRPLTAAELKEVLDFEVRHETKPVSVVMKEMEEGKLPYGAKLVRGGRHPMISGGSEPQSSQSIFPPGVTEVSNGCPTPGVAGQPGTPGTPPALTKAGVKIAP